jgi:hypothetical protein
MISQLDFSDIVCNLDQGGPMLSSDAPLVTSYKRIFKIQNVA